MPYCTLTDADGAELWHGCLRAFCIDNAEAYAGTLRQLQCGPVHFRCIDGRLGLLRLERPHLTREDTTITELDAAILLRLADRMARTRAPWFAPADGSRESTGADYRRRQLSQTLLAHYFSQGEGYREAHTADVQRMRDMDRLSRADWLPARAVACVMGE